MKNFIKPSAIIFDFDDTLVNSKPIIKKALEETFKEFGINNKALEHVDFNLSLRDYFHEIFASNIEKARDSYYRNYTNLSKNLKSLENAEETLKLLKNNNVFTSILSNKQGERLRHEITEKFNWQKYFVNIIGSGDALEDKPSKIPAIAALKNSGLENFSNVWLIGDSYVDLKTAQNLGCKAILFGEKEQKDDVPIHIIVKNHFELLNILEELYA